MQAGKSRLGRVVARLFARGCSTCAGASDEIDYHGQKIKLSKSYTTFDDYKNDPSNIARWEIERVQQLVANAPIGSRFETLVDASKAVGRIAFPGYASGGLTETTQADGSVLAGFSVEIPQADKERYFVFRRGEDRAYTLIDDFIIADVGHAQTVDRRGDVLVFRSSDGREIFTRAAGKQ
jgi:hypothetical protein